MAIITLSGLHGTGKSTIGKLLSEHVKYYYFSTGQAFRDLAEDYEMNIEQFTEYVENHPEIDKLLDQKAIEVAHNKKNVVIESQLASYLLKDEADFKILLTAPLEVRVQRMCERDESSYEEKLKETTLRETSEEERFKELYDIDLKDEILKKEVFNLIINTKSLSIEEIVNKIIRELEENDIIS
ncbi:MAG: AAA family ATPase|nr:AAA family ATPase [Candidatus Lokiarchaeota archaeon]MBD3202049.1 AAA family ATPase [Candidatus Lokiarchaeota archaeon]